MRRFLGLVCLCGLLLGCGVEATSHDTRMAGKTAVETPADAAGPAAFEESAGGEVSRTSWNAADSASEKPANDGETAPRIIYMAEVELVADDFDVVREQLTQLIEESGGYIASSSLDRNDGQYRTGRWVARVPVGEFDSFLSSLDGLGFVESRDISSEDVTMEYVDVASRIANLKRLEERFISLLENKTGKLEDVLKVEQELARVRGEIERAEGRMRYLTNRTDYSTVTINVREERIYAPPQTPTLASQISDVWFNSIDALSAAGVAIVLAVVAMTPWLVVIGLFLALVYGLVRLAWRRRGSSAAE